MRGLVVKLVSRMYHVKTGRGTFKCKTKGKLRLESAEPLVGDHVMISDLDESEMEAMIEEIVDRKNSLVRPRIANVDKVFIVIAALNPEPDLDLIDKLLIQAEMNGVKPAICLNKTDLPKAELSIKELESRYRSTGYEIVFLNDKDESHKNLISRLVKGINLFMGQSGVGKSSIINALSPDTEMEVGEVSEKLGRGRHTTRHSELSDLGSGIYICDSPGFSSFEKNSLAAAEIIDFMPDLRKYKGGCRFSNCRHVKEPDCAIREALESGEISEERYKSFISFQNGE